ncbi:helix-turn-helix domain-containing protein [Catenulispora rubra]|uniref:helix-turn-helix domain-containing protein n=1 Tax=Catenulispora rubra TaxID=280293 RepID=UPI001E65D842|nr:helix-turn-helix domain-containing protein [Catenulispora rubra]
MVRTDSAEVRRPAPVLVSLASPQGGGLPAVLDIPSAGRLLGIGRFRAYRLAAAGEFPCRVLRVGCGWKVPTADLLAVLGLAVASPLAAGGGRAGRGSTDQVVTW